MMSLPPCTAMQGIRRRDSPIHSPRWCEETLFTAAGDPAEGRAARADQVEQLVVAGEEGAPLGEGRGQPRLHRRVEVEGQGGWGQHTGGLGEGVGW